MLEERWQRTLAVTAFAQVLSIVGFNFVTPFLPLYIQDLGIHGAGAVTFWAALLSGGTALTMTVTSPIWGVLADRHGRKVMVVRAMLSAAVVIGLMGLAQNVWELLALRLVQGAFTGTVSASQALVASQTPRDRLGMAMGVMQTAVFLGTSVGPLAGGLAADLFGFRASFLAASAFLLCGGAMIVVSVREDPIVRPATSSSNPRFWQGMRLVLSLPAVPAMIGAVFGVQFALTVVFPVLPQFVQQLQGSAGHAATVTGLIFAGSGVAGAVASVLVGLASDRVRLKSVLIVSSALAAAFSIPQFWVTATWQIAVLRVVIGLAVGAMLPATSALIATLVPSNRRGTAYGLTGSATSIGFGVGPLTAAAVVDIGGIRPVFLTAAVVLGVIALWVGLLVRIPDSDDVASVSRDTADAEAAPA